ncbi:MAG: hypothetical protein ACXWQZ_23930, partial [Ktedonobacterales bacterium]
MTEFWLFRAIQRIVPGRRPAIALPTSDALRNTDGGPGNRPGGPERPSQMGPNGPGQPRGGGGGTGWISRLFLLVLVLVVAYNAVLFFNSNS